MFMRQLRWVVAGLAIVAGVCISPAQSKADVQILVEELNAGGPIANAFQFTTAPSPVGGGVISFNFNNGIYFGGGGTVTVNSSNNSLNPSFSGFLTSSFDASQPHTLRITVTNDQFSVGDGFQGTLLNDSGASDTGLTNGIATVTTFSRIYNPTGAGTVPASSPDTLADGATVSGPTAPSTVSGAGSGAQTTAPATSLPSPFAIQQTILISINPEVADRSVSGVFGATGGARVSAVADPAPVPAPGGLVLGLIALPLLGLRRTLRKRAAV